jgi:hypothetical protein
MVDGGLKHVGGASTLEECEFGIIKTDLLRSITALNYKFGLKAKVL